MSSEMKAAPGVALVPIARAGFLKDAVRTTTINISLESRDKIHRRTIEM